jgi:hypothetical protein
LAELAVDGWEVRDLPKTWCLPPQLDGKLHASCRLDYTTASGKFHAAGTGSGKIRDACVGSLRLNKAIRLALRPGDGATNLVIDGALDSSKLSEVASVFGVTWPSEASGQVALEATMILPLDSINDPATFRA